MPGREMEEIFHRCVICGKVIRLLETYLLAEGPTSDVVRDVCRACYLRKSREIRRAVKRESGEGFIP
jgi:hypothetical protein